MGCHSSSSMTFLPWLSLAAIIWLQSICGTNSDFSEYSSHLKSQLGITQLQLGYLAVASDAGKLLAFCSGIAAQYLPIPFILMIGAAIGLVGYGVPFLFMTGKIAAFSYWQAVLLSMLAGNSICWINTACYIASMRNFPGGSSSAAAVGLTTSYSALSAKIYIAVSQVILGKKAHQGNKSIYLFLNSMTPLLVGLVTAPLLVERIPAAAASGISNCVGFMSMFIIACATGAYSVVMTVMPSLESRLRRMPAAVLLILVLAVVVIPMAKAMLWLRELGWRPTKVAEEEREETRVYFSEEEEEVVVEEMGREHGVKELLLSVNFWLYFWVYLTGGTLGLVYMNNLGQISQSRGVSDTSLLSISSSFTFFGKLASAPLTALTRGKYMVSTPALMSTLMPPIAASFFLLLDRSTTTLYISTAIIGMCSGAMTSIAISMTAEMFGRKRFSVNHNILIANIPIGSFMFGYIGGYVYDKEGDLEHEAGICNGVQCYRNTFILWGLISLVGCVLSFVLYCRTRRAMPKLTDPVLHSGRTRASRRHDPEIDILQ